MTETLKIVYVLVSDYDDYFYEQLLISVLSLRYRMSNVNIVLLTEEKTVSTLVGKREEIYSKVDKVVVQKIDDNYSMAAKSRILKTLMRNLVEGDFLYIDCDTVVCDTLQEIANVKKTSAVLDNHQLVDEKIYEFKKPIERAKLMNYSVGYQKKHFNSGVLWCKDDEDTHILFKLWNELWSVGYKSNILADQLSFNESNSRLGGVVGELEGIWNCQLRYGIPYLADAKIIHYFASNFSENGERKFGYYLTDCSYFRKVREQNEISDDVIEIISKPKSAFNYSIIIDKETTNYKIISSNIGALLRYMSRKHSRLFAWIDAMLGKIRKE